MLKSHIWISLISIIVTTASGAALGKPAAEADFKARATALRQQLTLEEKVKLTYGQLYSGGVSRLNIEQLMLSDGPLGVRMEGSGSLSVSASPEKKRTTQWPSRTTMLPATLGLAATWNRDAVYKASAIVADEMLALDAHMLLAPGLNLMRDPRGGRSFEYFGEDPYLTAEMGIRYVRGLQDKGVAANIKHYVGNDMEQLRHLTSSRVDEQTLREIYVYPFERAIREGGAWSLMVGNNLLNDLYVCESQLALKRILRERVGFDGVILTDWRGAYNAVPSAKATLDMTTSICEDVYGDQLLAAVQNGDVTEAELDAMVDRILLLYLRTSVIDAGKRTKGAFNTPAFIEQIRQVTTESLVLIKNQNVTLPLQPTASVVVTGPGATKAQFGKGSSSVNRGFARQTILEGLRNAFTQVTNAKSAATVPAQSDCVVYCAVGPIGGENKDLGSIELSKPQIDELRSLRAKTKRLIVVLQTTTSTWQRRREHGVKRAV